jgi:hypothetical protein
MVRCLNGALRVIFDALKKAKKPRKSEENTEF